jgi:Zn-finger in ubiquitin-hydrolases and other protein
MVSCAHLDQVLVSRPDRVPGCEDCLAIGGSWVHLRVCRNCGHVACCDSSPNRHASAHARQSGHPIVTSVEAGEDWSYCYVDDVAFVLPDRV